MRYTSCFGKFYKQFASSKNMDFDFSSMKEKNVLIVGGGGFIGSNFIGHILTNSNYRVVNLDKLTYAGNLENLKSTP